MGIINSLLADSASSHPVKVISVENHIFQLHTDELKLILENDNIKDHYVMVLSIAGAFQKGKSFLLNIFLKYLEAQYKRHDVTDWLGENEDGSALQGFGYQDSHSSEANGIWIWSELFTHTFENGDNVAIVLIDTQGLSDPNNISHEFDTAFAMSILLSSVQCYNVEKNIEEDDLRKLQLITEYGQLAQHHTNGKPFQKLLFIIRDWSPANEHDYGWDGEQVERILCVNNDQTQDMQLLNNWIKSSFDKIDGFLLPYPGSSVVDGNFSGDVRQIDPEFRKYVKELAVGLLAPDNIIIKKINGQKIRAHELSQYLQTYLNVFTSVESPRAQDIYNAVMDSDPKMSNSELKDFDIVQMVEAAEMKQAHEDTKTQTAEKVRSLQDPPDVWSKFGKLTKLHISVDGASQDDKQKIYANSRNQIKLVITIGIEDVDGNQLVVEPNDLNDKLYLCDFETQQKLESPWQLSDIDNVVGRLLVGAIIVYKYISCSAIDVPSKSGNFAVGVIIPHVGEFNTSHEGTKTQNGKSGGAFCAPKSFLITALHAIDYSIRQNINISSGDFELIHSNLGWTSRFSREGPYDEHNDGKCELRLVHILPEYAVTGQQEFKKYEIIECNGVKNDEVNQFSAVWGLSNALPAEKCFDLLANGRGCAPCAVIGHGSSSDYHVNVWFPPVEKPIHIDGHVWLEDTFYFYRFFPYATKNEASVGERGAVTLSLYKFKLPVGGLSQYGWKNVIRTVKIKVTDLYENEGTFELVFDDADNFDKPGFK